MSIKRFAVIGYPVSHSLSPIMFHWIFNSLKIDAEYKKIEVKKNELPQIINKIKDQDLDGINVTIPYKQSIMHLLDDINPRAKAIGAVNCVMKKNSKIIGNNTDWYGFIVALQKNKIDLSNKEIIILGAGGAAKSIIFALEKIGIKKIILCNRTLQNAQLLQNNIIEPHKMSDLISIIKYNSVIINTTSVGMKSSQSPIDHSLLHNEQILIDIIYTPLQTQFIKYGNAIGARTLNGLDMFIHQGLASLDLWFGESLSKQVNLTQIKSYLETKLC